MDKILIIQDSPSINAVLKFKLEKEGFSVETVESGEEGVKKAKAGQYQLILIDYKLPGIDGTEVCKILKKEKKLKNTPMVILSATDEDVLRNVVKDAGADGYINSPYDGKELVERLGAFIKSRQLSKL